MTGEYLGYRFVFNMVGGCLTLLSLQLPMVTVNGTFPVSLQADGVLLVPFFWILSGAMLSFLSRYGGVMTITGMLAFMGEPYLSYGVITVGMSVPLAVLGAVLTFAGMRWAIPKDMVKGREAVGGILYSVGFLLMLTLSVGFFYSGSFSAGPGQLIVEMPLLLVGMGATWMGLRMFL